MRARISPALLLILMLVPLMAVLLVLPLLPEQILSGLSTRSKYDLLAIPLATLLVTVLFSLAPAASGRVAPDELLDHISPVTLIIVLVMDAVTLWEIYGALSLPLTWGMDILWRYVMMGIGLAVALFAGLYHGSQGEGKLKRAGKLILMIGGGIQCILSSAVPLTDWMWYTVPGVWALAGLGLLFYRLKPRKYQGL